MGRKLNFVTIFLLVLGGAAIPGGFILNNYIDNLLYENVDTGLSGIEDEFIPTAEQMILDMGPAIALPMIENQSIPIIEEMIRKIGPSIALDLIQQTSLPIIENMIQEIGPAIALDLIQQTSLPIIESMVHEVGSAIALDLIRQTSLPIVENMIKKIGPAIALDLIQQTSLPIIENMIQEIGPTIALNTIRELAIPLVEKEIYKVGLAIALQTIKKIAVPANRLMVNASFLAQLLYQAYQEGMTHSMDILGYHVDGGDALLNLFFDYNDLFLGTTLLGGLGTTSFSEQLEANGLPPILGVSEWWSDIQGSDIDLEIGVCDYALLGQIPQPNPNDILSWGNPSQKDTDLWRNNPPGFIQHSEKGFGILDFLTNFSIANETGMHSEFLSQYYEGRTLNWNDFEILARYFNEYWIPIVMPILLGELQDSSSEFSTRAPEYVGMSLDDISYYEFLKQWINYSTYPLGVDFHSFIEEIPVGTYGLEVNSTISTNSAYDLWNETNKWSFLNTTGIIKWFDANSSDEDQLDLAVHFGLNSQQVSDICKWLWGKNGFSSQLFPMLVSAPTPYGYGISIEKLSQKAFYELWANGTALGLILYPEGIDFGEFFPEDFDLNTTGFEVGVPIPTAISSDLAEALWNESNPFSLTNITGIQLWADANSSLLVKDEIHNAFLSFGISFDQIDQILDWLWDGGTSFSQFLLPILINSSLGYGMNIKELARYVLYEQWANGTTLGLSLFPDGLDFGEFIEELPLGTVGFEVGIPMATEMPIKLVEALWNECNDKSLLNTTGIELWFDANTSLEDQATLISAYGPLGLTQEELDRILQWLWYPEGFVDSLFPKLAESPAPYGYGKPIPLLAEQVFYEMWANGTALGLSLFPDGLDFGEFVDELPLGTVGFELGIPTPTGMSLNLVEALWNTLSQFSLTNVSGIQIWASANSSSTEKTVLYNQFSSLQMTNDQITLILDWLWGGSNSFNQALLPTLINSSLGYGMDIKELARYVLYEQWANGTILDMVMFPDGIDFHEFIPSLPPGTTGFEVGIPISTEMPIKLVEALWNESEDNSLLNITGIELWFDANTSLEDQATLISDYESLGLTQNELEMILQWLWYPGGFVDSLFPKLVEIPAPYGYGKPIPLLAEQVFYEMWANGTALGLSLFPDGLDFGEFIEELPLGTIGFEVGIPIPTGMSFNLTKALWDKNNEKSLLNITGIELWFNANESIADQSMLISEFGSLGLTQVELEMILQWLWYPGGFLDNLFPKLVEISAPYGYGKPIPLLAMQVFYEMWANGTALGLNLFPDGLDFGEFVDSLPLGMVGFEVGIPTPTGLLTNQIENLWDTSNSLSLTNMTGIGKWKDAYENNTVRNELKFAFGLSDDQVQLIINWLWNGPSSFSLDLLPKLLESELGYNMTINDFAYQLLLEQWSNGTIMGMVLFPGGIDFHDFIPSLPPGTIGFEVGIPIPTNMSIDSAKLLWDSSNAYSLVHDIQVWWDIDSKHSKFYNQTRDANLLDDKIMNMLLQWLPDFKSNLMPLLAQYDMNLPMDAASLGSVLQLGMIIGGTIVIGVSSTTLTRSTVVSRKKKKLAKVTSKKPVDKISKYKQESKLKENVEMTGDVQSEPESTLNEGVENKETKQENVKESDIEKPEINDKSEID